jgi:hypothetical protein
MCGGNVNSPQKRGCVVRHHLHGDVTVRHRGSAGPPVVEGDQTVAVQEPVELELPRFDGVAQAADEQDVRSSTDLFRPDVEVTDANVLTHGQPPSPRRCKFSCLHPRPAADGCNLRSGIPGPVPVESGAAPGSRRPAGCRTYMLTTSAVNVCR